MEGVTPEHTIRSWDSMREAEIRHMIETPANEISRNRDRAKGKVRHRPASYRKSVNISNYRIEKVQFSSLKESKVEPDPVHLTREELWKKL